MLERKHFHCGLAFVTVNSLRSLSLSSSLSRTQIGKRKTGTINPANIWQILRCSSRTPKNAMGGICGCVSARVLSITVALLCVGSQSASQRCALSRPTATAAAQPLPPLSLAVYRSLIQLCALPLLFGNPRLFGFASFVGARSHSCAHLVSLCLTL